MTAPIPGEVVFNPILRVNMHKVAEYDDGSRAVYSDMLEQFARHLKRRIKNKWQNVIVITGTPGSGKSTIGIRLAKLLDPEIDLEDSYIYYYSDLKDRMRRIRNQENHSMINIFDEGSVILNSMNSRSKDDNGIVVLLDILRSWGMTTIICIPSFEDLNKRVRAHLVDYWIQCPVQALIPGYNARGFYEIYQPKHTQWSDKTYWNCLGAGVFSKLPKEVEKEYIKIKTKHQNEQVDRYIGDEDKDEQ